MKTKLPITRLASAQLQLTAGSEVSIEFELKTLRTFLLDMHGKLDAVKHIKRELQQTVDKINSLHLTGTGADQAKLWLNKASHATDPLEMIRCLTKAVRLMDLAKEEANDGPVNSDPVGPTTPQKNNKLTNIPRTTAMLMMTLLGMQHGVMLISRVVTTKSRGTKELFNSIIKALKARSWMVGQKLTSDQQNYVLRIVKGADPQARREFSMLIQEVGKKIQ